MRNAENSWSRRQLTSGRYVHVRFFSDELETATQDGSVGLAPNSSGTTVKIDNTVLLLGQGKSSAHVIPHQALITYGGRRT
jgi:hypothetical protein